MALSDQLSTRGHRLCEPSGVADVIALVRLAHVLRWGYDSRELC